MSARFIFFEENDNHYLSYPDGTGKWITWGKEYDGRFSALSKADATIGEYIRKHTTVTVTYTVIEQREDYKFKIGK